MNCLGFIRLTADSLPKEKPLIFDQSVVGKLFFYENGDSHCNMDTNNCQSSSGFN